MMRIHSKFISQNHKESCYCFFFYFTILPIQWVASFLISYFEVITQYFKQFSTTCDYCYLVQKSRRAMFKKNQQKMYSQFLLNVSDVIFIRMEHLHFYETTSSFSYSCIFCISKKKYMLIQIWWDASASSALLAFNTLPISPWDLPYTFPYIMKMRRGWGLL